MSDTPITAKLWREYDHTVHSSDWIFERMAELERAANAMREHIENTPCWTDAALRLKRKVVRQFDELKKKI